MHQALLELRRANQAAGATRHRLACFAHDRRSAFGALRRHDEDTRIDRALFDDAHDHLRNHVARAPHHDGIANAHIFARDFVGIVQCRIGHNHAADLDRQQSRHGRDRAGTPDLHRDVLHHGGHFLRGKFMGNRPARRTRHKTQRLLLRAVIDLIHHAVNVKR